MNFSKLFHSRILIAFFSACFALAFGGCEIVQQSYRTHPEFSARLGSPEAIVAAPSDIEIRQISTGGVSEQIDEYSEEANRLVAISLKGSNRSEERLSIETKAVSDVLREDFAETSALAKTVMRDVLVFSYHDILKGFEHKREDFRYSIGDVSAILDEMGGDQMLFIYGYDAFTTAGRKFVNGMLTVLSAAASGGNTAYVAQEGMGSVYAMLVDRNGDVLWLTQVFDPTLDLRKEKDIDRVVVQIFEDLGKAKAQSVDAKSE